MKIIYIHEAVKLALEHSAYITRESWAHVTNRSCESAFKILPTNTPDCCVAYSSERKIPRCGWAPEAEDLMASDWVVVWRL